jgi:hypothetical protein
LNSIHYAQDNDPGLALHADFSVPFDLGGEDFLGIVNIAFEAEVLE